MLLAGVEEQRVDNKGAASALAVSARQVFSLDRGLGDLELSGLLKRWGSPLAARVVASKGEAVPGMGSGLDLSCAGAWVWPDVNG